DLGATRRQADRQRRDRDRPLRHERRAGGRRQQRPDRRLLRRRRPGGGLGVPPLRQRLEPAGRQADRQRRDRGQRLRRDRRAFGRRQHRAYRRPVRRRQKGGGLGVHPHRLRLEPAGRQADRQRRDRRRRVRRERRAGVRRQHRPDRRLRRQREQGGGLD